jgi:hypothetical protein
MPTVRDLGTGQAEVSIEPGVGTSAAGAITLNAKAGVITTESLTTAGLADYTLTVTNSFAKATSFIIVWLGATSSAGTPYFEKVAPADGSFVVTVRNQHATVAFNNTLTVNFIIFQR